MTYKTHEELGITAHERAALVATIGVLEQEQTVFDMSMSCSVREDCEPDSGDVTTNIPTSPCGTNLCIGGTMSILMQNGLKLPDLITPTMGSVASAYVNKSNCHSALSRLFWDVTDTDVEPSEGIEAIERFLTGNTLDPWRVR